jgi:hypothetical protein
MKALIAIAAVGAALFASTATAAAATGSDAIGRLAKPSAVEKSGRFHDVVQPSVGRWGAIGRWGVVGPNAAGFRW